MLYKSIKYIPIFYLGLIVTVLLDGKIGALFPYVFLLLFTYLYFESFKVVGLMNKQLNSKNIRDEFSHLSPTYLITLNTGFAYIAWCACYIGPDFEIYGSIGMFFLVLPVLFIFNWVVANKNIIKLYMKEFG